MKIRIYLRGATFHNIVHTTFTQLKVTLHITIEDPFDNCSKVCWSIMSSCADLIKIVIRVELTARFHLAVQSRQQ